MNVSKQKTVFSFDCGSTNWRVFRVEYEEKGKNLVMIGEPQCSPLTSFSDRKLPAYIKLSKNKTKIDAFGDSAIQSLEDKIERKFVRDNFKTCIGSEFEKNPQENQFKYSHKDSLKYTKLLVQALIDRLREEKWNSKEFDDRIMFSFAHPVHWETQNDGKVFSDFSETITSCFPEKFRNEIKFLPEPEGAIISLAFHKTLDAQKISGAPLIIDVGGSTTDLITGEVNPETGSIEEIIRYGSPHGGSIFDSELSKYLADELDIPSSELSEDPSLAFTLKLEAKKFKEALSRQASQQKNNGNIAQRSITIMSASGKLYRRVLKLDQRMFLGICRYPIADFEYVIEQGLDAMGLEDADISKVILVGGGSKLFSNTEFLITRFGENKVVLADNPEEVVVQGTAMIFGRETIVGQERIKGTIITNITNRPPEGYTNWFLYSSEGNIFPLKSGKTSIGRKSTNSIWLKDSKVSRFHAEFHEMDDEFRLRDLGTTNGTSINGIRIESNQGQLVIPGDKIKIGSEIYEFRKQEK